MRKTVVLVLRALVGALAGLAVSAPLYLWLADWLEGRTGALREMQGLAWNLVLVGVLAGALLGLFSEGHHPMRR